MISDFLGFHQQQDIPEDVKIGLLLSVTFPNFPSAYFKLMLLFFILFYVIFLICSEFCHKLK